MRLRLRRSDEQPPEQPADEAVPAEEGLRQWQPRLYLKLIVLLAVIAFAIGYLKLTEFRQFVLASNLGILTLAQTWRVGGVVFLILHRQGVLPGVFALPAGWGLPPWEGQARSAGVALRAPALHRLRLQEPARALP